MIHLIEPTHPSEETQPTEPGHSIEFKRINKHPTNPEISIFIIIVINSLLDPLLAPCYSTSS